MRSSMSPMLQTNDSGTGGASIQPSRRVHLQAADGVLAQQREEAVVGVLADAVAHVEPRRDRPARVVEDAKEDQRVGGVAAREVVGRQVERARDALHDAMPERGDLGHPVEDRLAKARQHVVAGDEVRCRAAARPPRRADARRRARCRGTGPPSSRAGPRSARRRAGTSRARRGRRAAWRSAPWSLREARRSGGSGLRGAGRATRRCRGRRRRRSRARGRLRRCHARPRRARRAGRSGAGGPSAPMVDRSPGERPGSLSSAARPPGPGGFVLGDCIGKAPPEANAKRPDRP